MGVNFGLNAAAILGLFLAVAGAGLFFLRSVRPELARDYDIFFAAVGLLCGIILLFNGWRLEPILEFCIFMLTGTATFFAVESIRMRGVTTEQARRNTETVDRDRPVSRTRVYTEAKVDRIDPYDNVYEGAKPNYNSPRLRGYDDPPPRRRPDPRRRTAPTADLREEPPRTRSRNRPPVNDYPERPRPGDRPTADSRREVSERSVRRPAPVRDGYDDWNTQDEWDDAPRNTSRPSRRPPREDRYSPPASPTPTPPSRPAPPDLANLGRSYDEPEDYDRPIASTDDDYSRDDDERDRDESIPGDFVVDYQPLDNSESDDDYDDYDDDSDGDGYNNYDSYDDESNNEYDDYRDRPETRKPINFDR